MPSTLVGVKRLPCVPSSGHMLDDCCISKLLLAHGTDGGGGGSASAALFMLFLQGFPVVLLQKREWQHHKSQVKRTHTRMAHASIPPALLS